MSSASWDNYTELNGLRAVGVLLTEEVRGPRRGAFYFGAAHSMVGIWFLSS